MKRTVERVLGDLEMEGAHLGPVDTLIPEDLSETFSAECDNLANTLNDAAGIYVPTSYQAVYSAALSPGIIDVIGRYLGTPPALIGVHARRDSGPEVPEDLRCWHLDLEDVRMIRIIIYLHDVDIHTGPFEYVPRPLTDKAEHLRRQCTGDMNTNSDYQAVTDETMREAVPESDWVACIGPRLTAVMADPVAVFHHTKPHNRERRTLTFSYTSRQPRFPKIAPTPGEIPYLTPEQRAHLYAGIYE